MRRFIVCSLPPHRRALRVLPALLLLANATLSFAGDNLSLHRKALLFETDMAERFLVNNQIAPKLRPPTADRPFVSYNMPDNAYMTGLYCAAESWRYAATGDPEARRLARRALDGLIHLLNVTGKPGLLARASLPIDMEWQDDGDWPISPDGKFRWRGDVSSDQVDGVIFGFHVFHRLLADDAQKPAIAAEIDTLVGTIIDDGLTIRGINGEVTTWGHYEPEYVRRREPMNALLMLQMLKVAHAITGKEKYDREYRRLIEDEGYARIAENSRPPRPPLRVNHSDDVLIAIALYPLLDLETDPAIRGHYLETARRWFHGAEGFPGVAPEAKPFFSFLYHHWTGDGAHDAAAIECLRLTPLDMKWNRSTIARYADRFDFTFDPAPGSPLPPPGAVVPIDRRPKSWSFLVHNPYREPGDRTADSGMEFQGLDYTLSYWFGLAHGMVERPPGRAPVR